MCDTIVVVRDEGVLFGKNSDRDVNEGQNLVWRPARRNLPGARVRCTFVDIPEASCTHAIVFSQPFWMWGAEMGTNEHGVTIGNEAVFTTERYATEPALLGMDLLRLALERAVSASDAVETILELLDIHGQGGPCGLESKEFTYHNAFIVADPSEAYILETAGSKWATERVERSVRTISNALTIPGFRERHLDAAATDLADGDARQERTTHLAQGATTVGDMMRLLQDHGPGNTEPLFDVRNGAMRAPCVHAGGEQTASQTTASWVSYLSGGGHTHWATGTSAPCLSLFKPISPSSPVDRPAAEGVAGLSDWWRHERLHRGVMRNPRMARPLFVSDRDAVQSRWIAATPSSAVAFDESRALTETWANRVFAAALPDERPKFVRRFWADRDALAGIAVDGGRA